MEVLQEWSCDQGVGDICPDHYRDIWHLRPVSADMLSYLASDVEISRPGLLANSTPRNGPNGGTTCVPGGWQTHVPVPESQIAGFLMSHSLGHLPPVHHSPD